VTYYIGGGAALNLIVLLLIDKYFNSPCQKKYFNCQ